MHINLMNPMFLVPALIAIALIFAWPGFLAPRGNPWPIYFLDVLRIIVSITIPLIWFSLSCSLLPEWKGACRFGWLDCFVVGKFLLTPIVLWACASLYALQVMRLKQFGSWLPLGLGFGTLVSVLCLLQGLIFHTKAIGFWICMFVPIYTPLWYGCAFRRSLQICRPSLAAVKWTALGSLPMWAASLWFSYKAYLQLPNEPPGGCYVVSAAATGHPSLIGKRHQILRHGKPILANNQLIILWRFEAFWQSHLPSSHRAFRITYNHFGPIAASMIRNPWVADCAYISLKPVEWIAHCILHFVRSR